MSRLTEDAFRRLASLLAPGFIRSAEGFFSTHSCHERLERVINSNSNHAKLSPPLPAQGQVDLSHPGTSATPGLQHSSSPMGAAGACRGRWLTKGMPKFAGVTGSEVAQELGEVSITSRVSAASACSPKTRYRTKRLNFSFSSVKPDWLSQQIPPQTANPLARLTDFSKTAFFSPGKKSVKALFYPLYPEFK